MKRWLYLGYGAGMYFMFLAVYLWFALFFANVVVAKTIDGPVTSGPAAAVAINLLLVAIFAAQHSVMARPAFKRVWTRLVPQPIERTTYVLFANLATVLIIWQWRPWPVVIWDVQQPVARTALWGLFVVGWLSVPAVSCMINHSDLFGLRQVWLYFTRSEYASLPFRTPWAYALVRHPLYLAWALAFWATPTMTAGHLLLASSLTIYMALAAIVEERDLVAHFGQHYLKYRQQVPMFVPRFRPVAGEPAEFEVNLSAEQGVRSNMRHVNN